VKEPSTKQSFSDGKVEARKDPDSVFGDTVKKTVRAWSNLDQSGGVRSNNSRRSGAQGRSSCGARRGWGARGENMPGDPKIRLAILAKSRRKKRC